MAEEKFELETNTIWSFPNRGKWATHDAKYRGNFSPYIAKKDDWLSYVKKYDFGFNSFDAMCWIDSIRNDFINGEEDMAIMSFISGAGDTDERIIFWEKIFYITNTEPKADNEI